MILVDIHWPCHTRWLLHRTSCHKNSLGCFHNHLRIYRPMRSRLGKVTRNTGTSMAEIQRTWIVLIFHSIPAPPTSQHSFTKVNCGNSSSSTWKRETTGYWAVGMMTSSSVTGHTSLTHGTATFSWPLDISLKQWKKGWSARDMQAKDTRCKRATLPRDQTILALWLAVLWIIITIYYQLSSLYWGWGWHCKSNFFVSMSCRDFVSGRATYGIKSRLCQEREAKGRDKNSTHL